MTKIIRLFTRFFSLWVVLLSIWAYFSPDVFIPLKSYMSPFFAVTMFGIGLTLSAEDFIRILKMPAVILKGSLVQFTVMPIGAFILANAFRLNPDLKLGLILTGCVPGAMASNVICYLCAADVAFSVSLTTFSTFLSPFVTPVLTYLLAGHLIKINMAGLFLTIIYTVVGPLAAGFLLKLKFKAFVEKVIVIFPALSVIAICLICAEVVALNAQMLHSLTRLLFLAVFILNLSGLVFGFLGAKLFRFEKARAIALAVEVGMQNAGLGVVLALKHFPKEVALPPAIFCIWCIVTASMLVNIPAKKP